MYSRCVQYLCRDKRLSEGCVRCGWQVQVGSCGADKEMETQELLPFFLVKAQET
jgi:hypothetical protein